MRKQLTKKHKPKTTAGRSASRKRESENAADDSDLDERTCQERLAWLSLPRLPTDIFAEIAKRIAEPQLKFFSAEAKRDLRKEITNKFGWTARRFDEFKMLAVAYHNAPSIEHYLAIRASFPELDIHIGHYGKLDFIDVLEDRFRQYGIDPWLVARAIDDGLEPSVDELCLTLMKRIVDRDKIRGPGQTQRRRATISDAMVNFLIALMLEGFDWRNEEFRIPASLILLIRRQLGPLKGDFHKNFESSEARHRAAWIAGKRLKTNETLSINRLITLASGPDNPISRSTAARWLKAKDFQHTLERSRRGRPRVDLRRLKL